MKKRIFSVIALMLACLFVFSACDGCFAPQELVFTTAFNNGDTAEDPTSGYKETLTYNVEYQETYDSIFTDSNLKAKKESGELVYEFSNGKYVSTLKVLKNFSEANLEFKSDIVDGLENNEVRIYHLHTNFSIDVEYKIGDKTYTGVDTIVSDSYFCKSSLSYAPIYSKTTASYTNLIYTSNPYLAKYDSESEIKYNKNNYTLNFTTLVSIPTYDGEEPTDNQTPLTPKVETSTYDYKFKTIIDNSQLLFALRNFNVTDDNTSSIPVVTSNYGKAVSLAINNPKQKSTISFSRSPLSVTIDNESSAYNEDVEVKNYRFYKNTKNETGATQYIFIQNNVEDSSLPYNSLLVRYVEPLITHGSFAPMGALVYTLEKVDIYTSK